MAMKIWKLFPLNKVDALPTMVICAETERDARDLAENAAAGPDMVKRQSKYDNMPQSCWQNLKIVGCKELTGSQYSTDDCPKVLTVYR